jgi:hypothetical protein
MRMIWSSQAPLEPSGALGPVNLLPLLPPLQATGNDALWAAIPEPNVSPVQGWPPAGCTVVIG